MLLVLLPGNYVGMIIEEKLAMGVQMVRVFAYKNVTELIQILNENGYGATVVEAQGARKKVSLIYIIVQRNDLENVLQLLKTSIQKHFIQLKI